MNTKSINWFPPSEKRYTTEEERWYETEGLRTPGECSTPNQLRWVLMDSETEAASTVSAPGPLCICYGCQLRILVELLTVGVGVSLTILPGLGTMFLLLGCFVQPQDEGFCLVLCLVLLGFGCCLLEAWYFLKRKQRRSG